MTISSLTARRTHAALVALVLLVGCGGARDSGAGSGAGGSPQARGDVTIDMKDIKYVPAAATAKVGDTVVWTNSDSIPHTVTKQGGPGADFDSGTIPAGGTYQVTVKAPGKIDYVCTIHPNQTGTLTVK